MVAHVHRDDDQIPVWPENVIERIAAFLGWQAARVVDCDDSDDALARIYTVERMYEWTVKIRVAATWVADGFDLDADRARDMVRGDLSYAEESEVEAEISASPSPDDIAVEQGYTGSGDPRLAPASPVRS